MFKNRATLRNRILSVAVISALGVTGAAVAATAVQRPVGVVAAPAAQFGVLTKATTLNRGDVVKSAVPLTRPVQVTVTLKLRDEAGMKAFLARPAASRGVMSQAQLANHLPTQAQAQAVADYLKGAGFTNIKISANRMLVNAIGSAAAVQTAFKTPLVNVHTSDGRNAFANSAAIQIPASLRGTVQAVLGLQTVHKAHVLAQTDATRVGIGGHMPTEFADIYGASSLPAATNVDAAVWGWGSMQNTVNDLTAFMSNTGLSAGTVNVVCTDTNGIDFNTGAGLGGISIGDPTCNGNFDEGETEWSMDSQSILGMSGGVKSLTFYAAFGGYNTTITDALNEIVTPTVGEPLAQVINASFGECERYQDSNQGGDGSMQSNDTLFQVAVAQGQTFSVSTGDSGSDECGDGQANSASYPASSPWVVAVSGTTLRASNTTWARENVWLDAGGSPSSAETAQSWQTGLTYGTYAGQRGPDVAFDANPSSGELVLLQGNYYQVGGTSLAAPLFAGSWARILQGNSALGFAAPHLYTLPAAVLHDVRAGNNGGYIAKPGWDWATGLGSFDVGRAAAILAPAQPEVRRTTSR
ncbi:MAG: Putative protease [Rhodanobacteraceae bacterium]|jgi:subtilase family serine protease|nr:MAG: Putative protease [Rhodanobacteraceae bacterium]